MYLDAMARLDAAGYVQYEISNVARPGRECRHNVKYWTDGEWLGFGPSAHSTRHGVRWRNVPATEEYAARLACGESAQVDHRRLAAEERLEEALFTGLRLCAGIDLDAIRAQYGVDVRRRYAAALEPFLDAGVLIYDGARMRLTRAGLLLAHEVMAVFIGSTVR
jgi:oxygen-independent coproporphyrinogen-3 oxidase